MINEVLIQKFLSDQCSEEELEIIQSWLTNPKNDEKVTAILKNSWDQTSGNKYIGQANQQLFKLIMDEIDTNDASLDPDLDGGTSIKNHPRHSFSMFKQNWMNIAASFILMIGVGFLVVKSISELKIESPTNVTIIEKSNPKGQKSNFMLPDGTMVILNSESSLHYNEPLGSNKREVKLSGEAFFNVEKDPNRPFIVMTSGSQITALGTSFNVRAYLEETESTISLSSGKVKVEHIIERKKTGKDLILLPGEEAVLNGSSLMKQVFDSNRVMAWKNGVIYFDNTDFRSTLKILERWYDVKFEVINEKNKVNKKGTGQFDNQSLQNVLRTLSYSLGFEYEIDDKTVTIKILN